MFTLMELAKLAGQLNRFGQPMQKHTVAAHVHGWNVAESRGEGTVKMSLEDYLEALKAGYEERPHRPAQYCLITGCLVPQLTPEEKPKKALKAEKAQ